MNKLTKETDNIKTNKHTTKAFLLLAISLLFLIPLPDDIAHTINGLYYRWILLSTSLVFLAIGATYLAKSINLNFKLKTNGKTSF